MPSVVEFLCSQLYRKLPQPSEPFDGQTIIITGSNTGIGLEAARHFVRLNTAKVILAVRSLSKGEAAAASIEESTGRKDVVQVWELDLSSYGSVIRFVQRANGLERVDAAMCNAGVMTYDFMLAEKDDINITVNVVSTLLLGLLLIPKMRETSVSFARETVLTFTGSLGHAAAEFPERKSKRIF
ncbi:Short-chain dehydrogenase TIC 32, chloroplastic 1 [Colletotrichum chlorophyti]|uniref:Short-chain dehydrogenase TIC 32, chloroplastic 1 n=1 Tax=Colletotrichum chlorophyti TaxID=708187 RepID=A0A1Q8RSB4_9PEZI|nr:Short-chain dehydrogenase TIC 32, chloroplastic 1 [Colletotrichum chlorophyti]